MADGEKALLMAGLAAVAGERGRRAAAKEGAVEGVLRHLELVRAGNERINLTAVAEPRDMVLKHALDSAAVLAAVDLRAGQRLLDVGSGAGFPGLTLGLLVPGLRVTLLESVRKKCTFLEEAGKALGLAAEEFEVIWGRAEEFAHAAGYRAAFDVVTARAVAELRILVELCLPFTRVGGTMVALKGPGAAEEVAAAERALKAVGGAVKAIVAVTLPEGAGERRLVVIDKVTPSAPRWPRRAGVPQQRPL